MAGIVPEEAAPSTKRLWTLRARLRGSDYSYTLVTVRARSLIQAEAVLRRRGFELLEGSGAWHAGRLTKSMQRDRVTPPLACRSCGYGLDGLTVRDAVIDCPECGHPQGVVPVEFVPHSAAASRGRFDGFLRMLGLVTFVVISVLIVVAFIGLGM